MKIIIEDYYKDRNVLKMDDINNKKASTPCVLILVLFLLLSLFQFMWHVLDKHVESTATFKVPTKFPTFFLTCATHSSLCYCDAHTYRFV